MALGDPYATRDEIKTYLGIPLTDTQDDTLIDDALASVTAEIEDICERQFNKQTTATARIFTPIGPNLCYVDDFHTTTDLVIKTDASGDGTFETTWTTANYELHPVNGVVNGQPGWPYRKIKTRRSAGLTFPSGLSSVQVTAQWGWAAVPKPVKEACKIATAETFALKDARFGVAGFGAMGDLRVRDNPMVMKKLKRYMRNPLKLGQPRGH